MANSKVRVTVVLDRPVRDRIKALADSRGMKFSALLKEILEAVARRRAA